MLILLGVLIAAYICIATGIYFYLMRSIFFSPKKSKWGPLYTIFNGLVLYGIISGAFSLQDIAGKWAGIEDHKSFSIIQLIWVCLFAIEAAWFIILVDRKRKEAVHAKSKTAA